MTLFASVLTHRTVGVCDLEQVALGAADVPDVLATLAALPEVQEVAVLSTCNRTEVYGSTADVAGAARAVAGPFATACGLPPDWFAARATVLEGAAAVRHLFRVTAGLDAMVPGEPDVQGQVRAAFRASIDQRCAGHELDALFRGALEAGRNVRAGSGLAEAGPSILRMGVEVVAEATGDLHGRSVAVVGAGRVARIVSRLLHDAGAAVTVVTRRPEAAGSFVEDVGARVVGSGELPNTLDQVDAVVMATAAPHPLLRMEEARAATVRRAGRTLVVVDLGLPRNVDPELSELDGVEVFDMERLARRSTSLTAGWADALAHANELLDDEVARHLAGVRARHADVVLAELHRQAAVVVDLEVERACRRLDGVDERVRRGIEAAVWRATRKVLHGPTARLRSAAAEGDVGAIGAAAWLFGVAEPTVGSAQEVRG